MTVHHRRIPFVVRCITAHPAQIQPEQFDVAPEVPAQTQFIALPRRANMIGMKNCGDTGTEIALTWAPSLIYDKVSHVI